MSEHTRKHENYQEVLNVLHTYAWAFDSNDMDQLASVFSDNAKTGGIISDTDMGWGPWVGRKEIVVNLGAIRESQTDRRRHQLTTPLFLKLTDTEASVKIYLSLFATIPGGQPQLVTTGEYSANLSKVSGQWKIDRLEAVLDGAF